MTWSNYITTTSLKYLFYNMGRKLSASQGTVKVKSNNTFIAHRYTTFASFPFYMFKVKVRLAKRSRQHVRKTDWREACVLMSYVDRSSVN